MKMQLPLVLLIGTLVGAVGGPSSLVAAEKAPPAAPAPAAQPQTKLVNVNTAAKAELEKLPGIGSVIADRIIAGRPYAMVDDLKKVEGIGERTFAVIKPLVTVE